MDNKKHLRILTKIFDVANEILRDLDPEQEIFKLDILNTFPRILIYKQNRCIYIDYLQEKDIIELHCHDNIRFIKSNEWIIDSENPPTFFIDFATIDNGKLIESKEVRDKFEKALISFLLLSIE